MRRALFVATVVMVLSTTTTALAQDRSDHRGDAAGTDCRVTDTRADAQCGERGDVTDRASDRPSDRVTDRPNDRVTDRERDRVTDRERDRTIDRVRDRVRDRERDRPHDERPHWRHLLKRCLWHHIGDRPLPDDLTQRQLLQLLRRCLAHHQHPGIPH